MNDSTECGAAGPEATIVSRHDRDAKSECRLFVLDTNVLMHDPSAIFRFQEHDVYLPMAVSTLR